MEDMLSWEQNTLLSELILGLEAAKKLQARLGGEAPSPPYSSPVTAETNEILMNQILSSYDKALLMLNRSSSSSLTVQSIPAPVDLIPVANSGGIPESPASINGSPRSEDLQDYNFCSKKRKMLPRWSEKVKITPERGLEGPQDDIFSWRKYGQKDILGAKFPRSYYRCTHRSTQNCWATKQVQRSDGDPTVFDVTYRGTHTCCSQTITPPEEKKKKQEIVKTKSDLLDNLRTNLTVRTDGLDGDGDDVFSFPETPPFYDFSHFTETSPIFDLGFQFDPTVEIGANFPTFLHESIYY